MKGSKSKHSKKRDKKPDRNLQSSRVVLVEKSRQKIEWVIDFLKKTQLFSTDIIPLSNRNILVYQESIEAGAMVFGSKSPKIVLARVIVLKNILQKKSIYNPYKNYYQCNINSHISNKSHARRFFTVSTYYNYSDLVAIPYSTKDAFIKSCLNYKDKDFPFMESFPIFKIPVNFSPTGLKNGTFLMELDILNMEVGQVLKRMWACEISLFKRYVSLYHKGSWKEANKAGIINKQLNGHRFILE